MKSSIILLVNLFILSNAISQSDISIRGRIVLMNSKYETGNYEYIDRSLVEVDCPSGNCKSQMTDSEGKFHLVVSDRPHFSKYKIKVSKPGYVVVDESQLTVILGQKDEILITLTTKNQLEKNRLIHQNTLKNYVSKKSLNYRISQKDSVIFSLTNLLKGEEIEKKALKEEIMIKDDYITILADRWARTNLDDKTLSYRNAFELIKKGDFSSALKAFDYTDVKARLIENQKTILITETNIKKQANIKIQAEKQREEDLLALIEIARIKSLENDINGSIEDYKLGMDYSPENQTIKLELAYMYQLLDNEKLIELYLEVSKKEKDAFFKSCALNNLGGYYATRGEYKKAQNLLFQALIIRDSLYKKDQAKGNYIETLINLSYLYFEDKEYDTDVSVEYSKKALEKAEELFNKNNHAYYDDYIGAITAFIKVSKTNLDPEEINSHYLLIENLFEKFGTEDTNLDRVYFKNSYGLFLKDVLKRNKEAQEAFGEAINLYLDIQKADDFFKDLLNFGGHLDPILGLLYRNIIKTLNPKENQEYIEELYGYAFAVMDYYKTAMPKEFFNQMVPLVLDNTQFQLIIDNYNVDSIERNYDNLERMINNEIQSNKKAVYEGLLNNQRGLFYTKIKRIESAMKYFIKAKGIFLKLHKNRPHEWTSDLFVSEVNIVSTYMQQKRTEESDRCYKRVLLRAKRSYLKNIKKEQIDVGRISYVDMLIDYLSK